MNDSASDPSITSDDLAAKMSELQSEPTQAAPVSPPVEGSITRNDFLNRFEELKGGVDERTGEAKNQVVQIGAAIGALVVLIGFVLGMRRGKSKTTVVEIRRV
jgi:hypothetical protein